MFVLKRDFFQILTRLKPSLKGGLLALLTVASWRALADYRPDFGIKDSPSPALRIGIADGLSAPDKARFVKIRQSMVKSKAGRYRFKKIRTELVDLLDYVHNNPTAICTDRDVKISASKKDVALVCTTEANGQKEKKNFNHMSSLDVNKILNKQVLTPDEAWKIREEARNHNKSTKALQVVGMPTDQKNLTKKKTARKISSTTGSTYSSYISDNVIPSFSPKNRLERISFTQEADTITNVHSEKMTNGATYTAEEATDTDKKESEPNP
ncbi:MAG: hypothetical protein KDD22_05210 [Bdellovibrionales bacterium]|nr:hypothetical protein [Bdellovibrionales bacterium]